MDKLPEPEFIPNKNWPRLMTGVEDYINSKEKNRQLPFLGFSAGSIFRYWREVTFYKKRSPKQIDTLSLHLGKENVSDLAQKLYYDGYNIFFRNIW